VAKKKYITGIRDRLTGRFVSKKKRSKKQQRFGLKGPRFKKFKRPIKKEREIEPPQGLVYEWIVTGYASARYEGKKGHQLNIIATGRTAKEAMDAAYNLTLGERGLREAVMTRAVKANITEEESGVAEWRNIT